MLIVILKIHLQENRQIEVNKNWTQSIDLSSYFYVIGKGEVLWLMLIVLIIRQRNKSVNILLSTLHDRVSVLFNLS